MGKGNKDRNPADAHRKEQRKKELAKMKKERLVVREVRDMLNDPTKIDDEIRKAETIAAENKLDKSYRERVRELQRMKEVAMTKQLVMAAAGKTAKAATQQRSIFEDEEDRRSSSSSSSSSDRRTQSLPRSAGSNNGGSNASIPSAHAAAPAAVVRRPELSIYFHPIYNPTGAPPPGAPEMYRQAPAAVPVAAPVVVPVAARALMPPPPRPFVITQPQIPFASNASSSAAGGSLLVGGMHGIPLPPPRPPQQQQQQQQQQQLFYPAATAVAAGVLTQQVNGNNVALNEPMSQLPPPPPYPPRFIPPPPPPQLMVSTYAPTQQQQQQLNASTGGYNVAVHQSQVQPAAFNQYQQQQQQLQQQQLLQQQQQRKMKQKPPKPRAAAQFVDPLDPEAAGYTERFASQEYFEQLKQPAAEITTAVAGGGVQFVTAEYLVAVAEGNINNSSSNNNSSAGSDAAVTNDVNEDNNAAAANASVVTTAVEEGPLPMPQQFVPMIAAAADAASSLPAAEEIMRRRHQLLADNDPATAAVEFTDTESSEVVGPALPTAAFQFDSSALPSVEELLRRRFQVSADVVKDGAATIESATTDAEDVAVGPSLPAVGAQLSTAEELLLRRVSLPTVEDVEDNDDENDDDDEDEDVVADASTSDVCESNRVKEETAYPKEEVNEKKRLVQIPQQQQEQKQADIPRIVRSFVPPSTLPSLGLALLGSYAVDDSDDEEDDSAITTAQQQPQHLLPQQQQQQKQLQLQKQHSVGSSGFNTKNLYPAELPATFASLPMIEPSHSHSMSGAASNTTATTAATTTAVISGQVRGPKIVKPDAALTAFVPTVLKTKRPLQATSSSSAAAATTAAAGNNSSSAENVAVDSRKVARFAAATDAHTSVVSSATAAGSNSVDDAYQQFFDEMKQLGALE